MLPEAAGRGQHFQGRGHSFSLYGPTLSRYITYFFFCVQKTVSIFIKTQGQNLTKALPWPVGRYRRILPALTTNQNAGFVTVPSENKINKVIHTYNKNHKTDEFIVLFFYTFIKIYIRSILQNSRSFDKYSSVLSMI